MGTEFSLGVIKMFWNLIEVVVAKHCEGTKRHWIVHFKMVNFVLCDFHLNKEKRQDEGRSQKLLERENRIDILSSILNNLYLISKH